MGWVGMGWDGLGWVELGWVGMGWDGLGWGGGRDNIEAYENHAICDSYQLKDIKQIYFTILSFIFQFLFFNDGYK